MVERYIRDVEVAGSNPVASIFFAKNPGISVVLGFFFFLACIQKPLPVLQCLEVKTEKRGILDK